MSPVWRSTLSIDCLAQTSGVTQKSSKRVAKEMPAEEGRMGSPSAAVKDEDDDEGTPLRANAKKPANDIPTLRSEVAGLKRKHAKLEEQDAEMQKKQDELFKSIVCAHGVNDRWRARIEWLNDQKESLNGRAKASLDPEEEIDELSEVGELTKLLLKIEQGRDLARNIRGERLRI